MLNFISRSLSRQILFVLALGSAFLFAAIIYLVYKHQTDSMKEEMFMSEEYMEHLIYTGIAFPMTLGDKEQVHSELLEMGKSIKDLDIFICNREQNIIFSSQEKAIGSKISDFISNKDFLQTLTQILRTGYDPELAFESNEGKKRYIITAYPILNGVDCIHCHGSSNNVLGSMVIKKNADRNYAAIMSFRNFNIIASLIGIIALTILVRVVLSRLVKLPLDRFRANINELTAGIPQGDYSSRIQSGRTDEIGDLMNSFNLLSEALEQKNRDLQEAHSELVHTNEELEVSKNSLQEMNETLELRVEERTNNLRKSERRVRSFALKLVEAEELERKRLSQELHDELGQQLSVLGINLNLILSEETSKLPDSARSRLVDSIAMVEEVTEKTRNMMTDLRSPVLDDYGLSAALQWYVDMFSSRTGISVKIEDTAMTGRPPASVENALFRIAQEVLTNTAKHARGTQVLISIGLDEKVLRMEIADNGIGFTPDRERSKNKWGLVNITERAEAIGGTLRIETIGRGGTRVTVEVPV